MCALRDLQRRDAERRRSAPPDMRSLPGRPQPAPGAERSDNDRSRGRNSGIVPPGLSAPPNAGAPARGGGRPAGDANPGRGNKDKNKDKDKGKK
jgi:hypothetical protein